jgi:hypothetical protein
MTDWIRPWYPGGVDGDHTRLDCPTLTLWTSTPVAGSGWLDPSTGLICTFCLPPWDATCSTCGASLSQVGDDEPFSETRARQWQRDHECRPNVRLIPPPRETTPDVADQPALFDLKDPA